MKRLVQCAAIAALTFASASAEADTLELEGAFIGDGPSVGPGFRFGLVLGDRLTIGVGVSAMAFVSDEPTGIGYLGPGGGYGGMFGVSIPVDLKVWILPSAPGTVSPTVRLVASYARAAAGNYDETIAYGGGVLAGAAYMVDDVIGFSLEAGVEYSRSFRETFDITSEGESITIGYRASIILRI